MGLLLRFTIASLMTLFALQCELCRGTNDHAQQASDFDDATHRRLVESKSESDQVPLIIVLGLPRSGSQQIHDYFECSGFQSAHYCCDPAAPTTPTPTPANNNRTRFPCREQTCGACVHENLRQRKSAFQRCSNGRRVHIWSQFDLESQDPFSWFLPQHYALSALHHGYENATWILNTRSSANQWATNVLHWDTDTHRLLNAFGIPYYSTQQTDVVGYNNFTADMAPEVQRWTADQMYLELKRSLERAGNVREYLRRLQALIQVYERHTQTVLDSSHHFGNSHSLVRLNVDDPNAGQDLATSFPKTKASCWKFDASALDNDWKDFSFKLSNDRAVVL